MQSWLYTAPVLIAILVWKPKDVFSITCDFHVQGSGGFISSESTEDCPTASWVITAPLYHNIRLKFETCQLSDSQSFGQNQIHIYDGLYTSNTLLGVFTGARRPFIIQSTGSFMVVKLIKQWTSSLSNFKGVYSFGTTKDRPKILITDPVMRAAPGHLVWCFAEGSPPINITIFKNSTSLANGTGLVMAPLDETGIYSCVASNEAGTDMKNLSVTIVDCGKLCFSHGNIVDGQVENNARCIKSNSSVDIFKCLPTTATNLNIKGNQVRYLPEEAFRHMVALKFLDIRDNEIEVLPEAVFSDLYSLQELFLSENNIQNLPENVFSALVSLQHLNLSHNVIRRLPPKIFAGPTQLRDLNLGSNIVEELPTGLFSNLQKLLVLDLKGNNVQNLTEELENLVNLKILILGTNRIEELPKELFSNLSFLEFLSLGSNKIEELPTGLFSKLSMLGILDLKGNNIQNLTENIFSALENLDILDLTENNIQHLPEIAFSSLINVQDLRLTRNNIQNLLGNVFSALVNLKLLRLDSNKIQHIPAGIFSNQRVLFFLDFSSNQIQYLPRGLFSKTLKLAYIFLHKNRISKISSETFSNLIDVSHLLLNENSLQVIPDQAFKNLRNLEIIMLSDNPIKTIGSQAFTIVPDEKLLIYMIRTELKNLSLQSFNDIYDRTPIISMEEGKIGILKLMEADHTERCKIHLGLGQDDTDYIHIKYNQFMENILVKAFAQAGFARKAQDENRLLVLPCQLGTFVDLSVSDPGTVECLECPAGGFYSDSKAFVHDSCLKCPNGTFVPYHKTPGVRARDCTACPQGTDTNTFAGYRACKCLNGFHRTHRFEGCKPCDQDGLNCENDYATLKTGYWWNWKNETYKHLYDDFTMSLISIIYSPGKNINSSIIHHSLIEFPHTLPVPHKCPREESCMGGLDSFCATGYQGPLCEVCSVGYYKQLQTCQPCPTKKWMIVQLSVMATVVVIVIAVLVLTGKKKSKKRQGRSSVDVILGRLKIVIGFYQVTNGVLEAFSYIKWPGSLALIGKYSETLQLSVFQIAPIHCLSSNVKMNAFGSLFAILAMNAAAIFMSVLAYALRKLFLVRSTLNEEQKEKKVAQTKELIYRSLFFFLYVSYLSTCSKTASVLPLACRTLCLDEEKETCDVYLQADFKVKCEGREYNSLVIVAYCAVFYIIILPTASLIALWRQRKMPHGNVIQAENEALEPQDQATGVTTGLRFLFENYNSHSWYWEFIETIRKVVLTSGLILVGGESRAYVGLACVLAGLYGMLFAYKSPIVDPFENKLMLTSLAVTFVNLGIGAVSKIPKERIPASIDPYVDGIMFNILVIGANSLVIGLLAVQYFVCIYCYIKEWRKNPKWSFSCCLAMVLPFTELQGEIRGLAGRNMLKQQLSTGRINMSSMSSSLKDSGVVTFDLAEDETNRTARTGKSHKTADTRNERNKGNTIWEESSTVDVHEQSRNVEDTCL